MYRITELIGEGWRLDIKSTCGQHHVAYKTKKYTQALDIVLLLRLYLNPEDVRGRLFVQPTPVSQDLLHVSPNEIDAIFDDDLTPTIKIA